jgi:hypothetical protein
MKPEEAFELLKEIKKVDAPPFMLTRIKQGIANYQLTTVSNGWVVKMAMGMLIIVAMNIGIVLSQSSNSNEQNQSEVILEHMKMNTSNELY